jgi:hypothetical protein
MNKLTLGVGLAVLMVVSTSAVVFAAGANVTSGALGQRASDASSFGVAVCNNGTADQTASVPFSATANGVTVSGQSGSPITAGACTYTYLPYASFNMIGGSTYSVQVGIAGADTQTYSVTVPGSVLGASTVNGAVDQNRINLMATEIQLLRQLIALIQMKLGF